MGLRVYLAGRMGGRLGRDVLEERGLAVAFCEVWGLEPVDPALGENISPDVPVDLKMDYITMKSFVAKDEYAIQKCDVLLVLTGDTPSEGTGWEMGLAHFKLGIPVVMVAPKRCRGELMGFSNIKVDALFPTVRDAVVFIANHYAGQRSSYGMSNVRTR